jgi:hypothetical protein
MKIISVPCKNGNTDALLAHLNGHVFHLTTQTAYEAILQSGEILHNKDQRFTLNTSSENSFGRLMGCVCFFDLRNESQEFVDKVHGCYPFLSPPWFGTPNKKYTTFKLTYLILNPTYYDRLIPYSTVHDHCRNTGKFLRAIPHGEVWIKERVPMGWIETVLTANIRHAASNRNTLASILHQFEVQELKKEAALSRRC